MDQTTEEARYARGLAKLTEVNGGPGEEEVGSLGDLGRYITAFGFGDVYTRGGLSLREREFAAVAMLTAMGGRDQQLQYHLGAALNVGVTAEQLEELIIQSALFAGFPVAIHALNFLKQVVAKAPARGSGTNG